MKTGKQTPAELRMSSKDFDKIMSRALQVHPGEVPKPKRSVVGKTKRKHK